MTDRLKTVYPPKTSFCGAYNKEGKRFLEGGSKSPMWGGGVSFLSALPSIDP